MKLTIKNFARIKEAEINIDGITIIAGENNTGKSTVGKILFSCFNSLNNLEKAILSDRKKAINREFFELFKILLNEYVIHNEDELTLGKIQNITNILYYNYINSKKNIYEILIGKLKEYVDIKDETIINHIKKTSKRIEEYINISYNKLAYKRIKEYFNEMFNNQINSRIEKDTIAEINILDLYFKFKNDERIDTSLNYSNKRNIFFIDNPFIFDRNDYPYSLSIQESHLINSILHSEKPNTLDEILAEEKLKNIYDKLSNAVNGKIVEKDEEFYLEEDFSMNLYQYIIYQQG
ncbi:hypothetical protein OFR20_06670 [Brachyspira hyodysenteriae]|nr:hypothetical protein [Brachyspira hyodysenteriae]MCZ9981201.1 hypothetical protein [Brachyspira hyodysenteriae]